MVANWVDAQIHLWNPETPETPWHAGWGRFAHRKAFSAADALNEMDRAGVGRAIVVPASWDIRGNDIGIAASTEHPSRFSVFAQLSLREPEPARVEALLAIPQVLGIRHAFPPGTARSYLADGTADWFWPVAAALSARVMVWAPGQTERLVEIATKFPTLRLAIDHLNLTIDPTERDVAEAVDALPELAEVPNVSVKASALCAISWEDPPFPAMQRLLRSAVDAFGPERVFWGSDLTRLSHPYEQAVAMVVESPHFSDAEKELVMGLSLIEWTGWPA